jgi:hypothetical protein
LSTLCRNLVEKLKAPNGAEDASVARVRSARLGEDGAQPLAGQPSDDHLGKKESDRCITAASQLGQAAGGVL